MVSDEKQPFLSHLEELRRRLVACAIAVGIGFIAAYFFKERLFQILILPLKRVMPPGDQLIFTNLPEMFFTYLKVAFVAGLLAAAPFIFYEIWMFVAPGLYQKEKKFLIPFVISSSILFVGGALFGYFIVFPFGFKFFMSFANEYIKPLPSVKQYFAFSTKLLLAFGLVFELPVVAFFLAKMGLINDTFLKKQRKFALLLIFVMAAILTPPDVVTQLMMAGPLMALYEISILVTKLAGKKKEEKEEPEDED
ncbi:MAG: twin-arginine translocase subunit TatC [Deltaproteobacteria bacterium]|nr:twin-arginine translocase subunit TatC [Deltaproteobacteria bacterium]MBW1928973.1 twin-arginine translocase subunit TatC [Deltaproteobacteria bacterium]MBW2025624.1 twin-arginine translocase subunit TatC [Deltaproteobacteria bacterium]MBW2125977.1 twin-arginine translocase subunit TatC [Deltaproteobacteria bacterium]